VKLNAAVFSHIFFTVTAFGVGAGDGGGFLLLQEIKKSNRNKKQLIF
jgi:hypothetical protein